MKIITRLLLISLLLQGTIARSQSDMNNTGTGIIYVTSGTDTLYVTGAFANASTSSFTNNGQFYVKQNLTNNQASLPIGTGTLWLTGTATQTVAGAQPFRTFNLVTNNSAGITLNSNLDVNGVHTYMAGLIASSATPNYLIYEAGSSYTGDGDNAHATGWVKKFGSTNFSFPVGNSTYERKIAMQTLSASSEFNAIYRGATTNINNLMPPIMMVDPYEYWELNRISGGTIQVVINWDSSRVAYKDFFLTDIRVVNYSAALWTDRGGTATGNVYTTGSVTSGTVSNFGFFTTGTVGNLLPLRFISVTAQHQQDNTLVQWKTAQEMNVDHFEIERSNSGTTAFNKIGSVTSHHIPDGSQYEYTDGIPLQGTAFYRIRAVDKDNKTTYSRIAVVTDNATNGSMYVLNNPAHQSVYLSASAAYKGLYNYELINTAGQVLQNGQLTIAGNDILTIPLSGKILPGIYILNVRNEAHRFAQRILVK